MWEDFGVRETLGQVVKQEKNVIWLKKKNIVRRNCTDARMNIVKAPNLGSSYKHTKQAFTEHPCRRRHLKGSI